MSPTEHLKYPWMKSYLHNLGLDNSSETAELVWSCSEFPCPLETFDRVGPKILLPLAHALVHSWKGRESIISFSAFAERFGLSGLESISWLQVNGVDEAYMDLLREIFSDSLSYYEISDEIAKRMGWSAWMACASGYDVLHEYLPGTGSISTSDLKGVRSVISNAEYLVKNLGSGKFERVGKDTKESILGFSQAILKDFGGSQTMA
jgi:hypothetical protein